MGPGALEGRLAQEVPGDLVHPQDQGSLEDHQAQFVQGALEPQWGLSCLGVHQDQHLPWRLSRPLFLLDPCGQGNPELQGLLGALDLQGVLWDPCSP